MVEVLVSLELKDPEKAEHAPYYYLKEDGRALKIARVLKDFLYKLLGANIYLKENMDIHVGITMGNVSPYYPPDWRQIVNHSQVNMVHVGVLKDSFVVWVDVNKYPWGDGNNPYIFLASLKPDTMSKLKTSGLDNEILEILRQMARQQLDLTAPSSAVVEDSDDDSSGEEEPCDDSSGEEEPCDAPFDKSKDLNDLTKKLEKLLAG